MPQIVYAMPLTPAQVLQMPRNVFALLPSAVPTKCCKGHTVSPGAKAIECLRNLAKCSAYGPAPQNAHALFPEH